MAACLSALLGSPTQTPWVGRGGDHATAFEEFGCLVSLGAVSATTTATCREEAVTALACALAMSLEGSAKLLGDIRAPLHRHDIKLGMTPSLISLLGEILLDTAIATVLVGLLGEDAVLCECSCIISEPGAVEQPRHCDTRAEAQAEPSQERQRLVSVFVALDHIDENLGPTTMYPGTHTTEFHSEVARCGPLVLGSREGVRMDLRAGSAVAMDSALWHCGGANSGAIARPLLVLSFAVRGRYPPGSTYSLLPALEGRFTIRSIRQLAANLPSSANLPSNLPAQDGTAQLAFAPVALASAEPTTTITTTATPGKPCAPTAATAVSSQGTLSVAVVSEGPHLRSGGSALGCRGDGSMVAGREDGREVLHVGCRGDGSIVAGREDGRNDGSDGGAEDGTKRVAGETGAGEAGAVELTVEQPVEQQPAACAVMPLAAVHLLLGLALSLPADEPLVAQCHRALRAAIEPTTSEEEGTEEEGEEAGEEAGEEEEEEEEGGGDRLPKLVEVPIAVLCALSRYRVLGPHLRASSRWGALQRCVDAQLAAAGRGHSLDLRGQPS